MLKNGLHLFLAALLVAVSCLVAAAHVPAIFEEHASEQNELEPKNRVRTFCANPPECIENNALQVQQLQHVTRADRSRIVSGRRITAITDPNGNQITYGYDSNGNLISETDQAGRKSQYTYFTTPAHYLNQLLDANGNPLAKTAYDGSGRLSTFTDALGNITTFIYDPVGLTQTTIEPLDPTTNTNPTKVTFYDSSGNVIQTTNEIYAVSKATYDNNNNPLTQTDLLGNITTYTYDAKGNRLTKKDPLGNATTSTYDANNDLTSVTDPRGNTSNYQYDGNGNLTSIIDSIGSTTLLSNDFLGRPVSFTDGLGHTTQFQYIDDPTTGVATTNPSVIIHPDGTTLRFTYNSFGSVTSLVDENGNQTQLVTDSGGILQQRIEADGSTTTYSYNSNGSLVSVTDALGKVTQMKYDAGFNLIQRDGPNGEVTKFTYDQLGRLSSKIDPLGRVTLRTYRADSVVKSITQPDGMVIAIDLDANGKRTGLTDPAGNHTIFALDGNSRIITQTDPLGKLTQYVYDPTGNISSITDRLGHIRKFSYNGNNQLTQEQWFPTGASSPIKTILFQYDSSGNLTNGSDDTGALALQYDSRSRLQTLTTSYTGRSAFALNYGYDSGSRVINISDEAGIQVASTYDQRNNLSSLSWSGTGIAATARFNYDALRDLTTLKRYADLSGTQLIGQTATTYGRNNSDIGYVAADYNSGGDTSQIASFKQTEAFGPLQNDADTTSLLSAGTNNLQRVTQQTHTDSNGNTIDNEQYGLDNAGEVISKAVSNDTTAYGYDSTGQLLNAIHSNVTSQNEVFTYDSSGNRLKTGTQATQNVISKDNRITNDGTYAYIYDDEGNLITKTQIAKGIVWTYAYDYRNRMTQAIQAQGLGGPVLSQVSYTYDLVDRRISKTVNGATTQFFYNNDNLWRQIDSKNNITSYLTGNSTDQLIARSNANGVNWYLTDRLGSVTGITDATGNLLNSTIYDSFGHANQSNPLASDQFAFTGREYDAETGLYYFRARYYNPDLGRFQSEDPIRFQAGDFNVQRYVENNPIFATDRTGLAGEPAQPTQTQGGRGSSQEYILLTGNSIKETVAVARVSATIERDAAVARDALGGPAGSVAGRALNPAQIAQLEKNLFDTIANVQKGLDGLKSEQAIVSGLNRIEEILILLARGTTGPV